MKITKTTCDYCNFEIKENQKNIINIMNIKSITLAFNNREFQLGLDNFQFDFCNKSCLANFIQKAEIKVEP